MQPRGTEAEVMIWKLERVIAEAVEAIIRTLAARRRRILFCRLIVGVSV